MSTPTSEARPLSANLERWLLVGLTGLSVVGLGVTDFSRNYGLYYWLAMVPLFGAVSLAGAWSRARRDQQSTPRILMEQLLHWSALALAMYLVYLLQLTGRVAGGDAGLVALLFVAFAVFLAGVYGDRRFMLLGAVLAVAVGVAEVMERFFWWAALPLLLGAGVLVLWRRIGGRAPEEGVRSPVEQQDAVQERAPEPPSDEANDKEAPT